jgi:hypothetical protein
MPTKFKQSERAYSKNSFGRMNTAVKTTKWNHFYIKCQSKATLLEAINSDRTKPKIRQKCTNELQRRGVNLIWK